MKTKYGRGDVFKFIVAYKTAHDGNSPSIREIQKACGISSTSMVNRALEALEGQGLIVLQDMTARGIEVVGGEWGMK